MADFTQEWVDQFMQEHGGQPPTYEDYQAKEIKEQNPNLSYEQIYYLTHGGGGTQSSGTQATPEYKPLPAVNSWDDWMTVYGSQPGEVDKMHDSLKAMQSGGGASALWSKFLNVAGDKLTDTQKQRLGGRFNNEFAKYQEESARAAQAGAAPIGFHNWLTGKGPAGLKADWEKMTPADRGETPWMFNERQRVQYR